MKLLLILCSFMLICFSALADDWYESEEATSYSSMDDHVITVSQESVSPGQDNDIKAFVPETLRDNKQMDDLVAQETGNASDMARSYDVPEDPTVFIYSGLPAALGCHAGTDEE
ncbi:MAG: hypothetical protein PHH49_05680 [Candidatus Omnitrophica bacterium]|nr:hypothetical protein [Candidatus Omnitrophota bacterium]MDD5488433.1 hypothetical protein [Candidatus Omnitrophota bacterium]